jgi:predicted protein tyrosine phosphatase
MKYFVVDIGAEKRAPYIAGWLNDDGHEASYGGLGPHDRRRKVSKKSLEWADVVLALEPFIERQLRENFPGVHFRTYDLDIPDHFEIDWPDGNISGMNRAQLKDHMKTNHYGKKVMDMYLEMIRPEIPGITSARQQASS